MMVWTTDELDRAEQALREAEAAARKSTDPGLLACVRLHQGCRAVFASEIELAIALGEEVMASSEAIPQGFNCNDASWLLARATLERDDVDRAAELYDLAGLMLAGTAPANRPPGA